MRPLEIEILHTSSCSNWRVTRRCIDELARDEGIAVGITETSIDDQRDAEARRFPGSPTVLVEGRDVRPPAAGTPADYGLG